MSLHQSFVLQNSSNRLAAAYKFSSSAAAHRFLKKTLAHSLEKHQQGLIDIGFKINRRSQQHLLDFANLRNKSSEKTFLYLGLSTNSDQVIQLNLVTYSLFMSFCLFAPMSIQSIFQQLHCKPTRFNNSFDLNFDEDIIRDPRKKRVQ